MPGWPSRGPPTVDIDGGGAGACGFPFPSGGLGGAVAARAVEGGTSIAGTSSAAERTVSAVFLADTQVNVHPDELPGVVDRPTGANHPRYGPPRRVRPGDESDTGDMKLSRTASWFLAAFGAWSWVIWSTFVKNLFNDASGLAFDDGRPTAYFWVHLLLAVTSFLLGTAVGVIGLRSILVLRRESR